MVGNRRARTCRIWQSANPTPRQPTSGSAEQSHNGDAERLIVSRAPRQDFLNPDPESLGTVAKERGAHQRHGRTTGESKCSKI